MRSNIDLSIFKKSKFRSKFKLKENEIEYVLEKGLDEIKSHATFFITERLAPAKIPNDGKQTPYKGHPVFIAQHATATCCRSCLSKWHKISKCRNLSDKEINYIVNYIIKWIDLHSKLDSRIAVKNFIRKPKQIELDL